MVKVWVIAWKELRTRFTDRNLLLIMLAAPLAISTIIGLAFGGLGSNSSPIREIPVVVVDHDQGSQAGIMFGSALRDLLIAGQIQDDGIASASDCPDTAPATGESSDGGVTLAELIDGWSLDATTAESLIADGHIGRPVQDLSTAGGLDDAARAVVDSGLATAAVIIPSGFSQSMLSWTRSEALGQTVRIEVYGNQGSGLTAGIVRGVVDSIVTQMAGGNIAIGATLGELEARDPSALANAGQANLGELFGCAFMPSTDLIQVSSQPVEASTSTTAGSLLVTFGSAQAMFFALFTGQFGILSMYEERRAWTLQRLLASPTPRWAILTGKLVGVLTSVLVQLLALVVALTVVGSLIAGKLTLIWGSDWPRLGLTLLAAAISVSGLGMLMAGLVRGIEQANLIGSVLNIALGVLGGGFGFQLPRSVSAFSIIYWGRDAFDKLAAGHGDIALNLIVLLGQGLLMFGIGLVLFNRRFEA